MTHERFGELLFKHIEASLNEAERQELDSWIAQSEENRLEFEQLTNQENLQIYVTELINSKKKVWDNLLEKAPELAPARVYRLQWWKAVAAAVILVTGSAMYYWLYTSNKKMPDEQRFVVANLKKDIAPGTTQATLTLSNGQTIILDSSVAGNTLTQGNTKVLTQNGQLVYRQGANIQTEILYNTLTTLRGQQYPSLVLEDGSKVWLNAASSLKYPVAFTGKDRRVEVTGEAYFEIAKNPSKPFLVKINDQIEIKVLGTHFNVNSYSDEPTIKTTLLEGLVQIKNGNTISFLKPGQQAQLSTNDQVKINSNSDIEEVMAWKNGRFEFHNADIHSIMRLVEKWYNVDAIVEGSIKTRYNISISRNVPISNLLSYLELAGGVHFRIEGNKVTVLQ